MGYTDIVAELIVKAEQKYYCYCTADKATYVGKKIIYTAIGTYV